MKKVKREFTVIHTYMHDDKTPEEQAQIRAEIEDRVMRVLIDTERKRRIREKQGQ